MSKHNKFILIAVFMIGLIGVGPSRNLLKRFSFPLFDLLQNTYKRSPPKEVVIIKVDQESIDEMAKSDGVTFPWPRQYYGAISSLASHLGASSLFFDIIMSENSSYGIDDDKSLASLIKESNIPTFMNKQEGKVKEPVAPIREVLKAQGSIVAHPSSDGVIRSLGVNREESIAYKISNEYLKRDIKTYEFIEYYQDSIATYSFYNLLREFRKLQDGQKLDSFTKKLKNKIWVVGYSAPGLYDLRPTPINNKAAGMSIHANAILNYVNGDGVDEINKYSYSLLLIIVSTISFFFLSFTKRPFTSVAIGLLTPFILLNILNFSLWKFSFWFNPIPIYIYTFGMVLIYFYIRFQNEWKERMRIEKGLTSSMSKEMMELLKDGSIDAVRFHENKESTILFSDIVGFTTITEKLSPKDLIYILDFYYDEVVNLIFEYNGYIDKFIGDAVMALWGVPLSQKSHSSLGLEAAINYKRIVDKVNEKLKEINPDLPDISARVGLHTGVVTAGNIGSGKRFNYTVIGDAVNLAARLESIGKAYDSKLLVSEETLIKAKRSDDDQFLLIDEIIVKGKNTSTKIYTYLDADQLEEKEAYSKAFNNYQDGEFAKALKIFKSLEYIKASKVIASRCEYLINNESNQYENGVWKHDSK